MSKEEDINKKLKILKVKDEADNYHKSLHPFNVSFRMIISGKSQLSGKSTIIVNLLRPEFFGEYFKGENIYLISPSCRNDEKLSNLIKWKGIPDENIIEDFDEELLTELYQHLKDEYEEAIEEGETPEHKLIIIDDFGYSGKLRSKLSGVISALYCNARHFLVSSIMSIQRITQALPVCRTNTTAFIMFSASNSEFEIFEKENNYSDKNKKEFLKIMRETTSEPHGFFIVSFLNKENKILYMNKDFEIIFSS
jgi:hypothetical protein